jgi:hypothetical protein
MTYVPTNTFIARLQLPVDAPAAILQDDHQFSGSSLNVASSPLCPEPFGGLGSGSAFCPVWCVNSCPHLNPNPAPQVADNTTVLGFVNTALAQASTSLAAQQVIVNVTGPVSFPIPATASTIAIVTAAQNIQRLLPTNFIYPLTATVCQRYC